jgi:membrane-associated phospholipid phosphatase
MIGILIAYCIYYFWPTFAPAYVIHHVRFPIEAAQLIERTIRIREYLPYELYPGAGLIAFPSCHVIMGLSSIFSFFYAYQETKQRALKRIFIVIAVGSFLLNLSLIASTVLLGYHYLVDVIASLVIFLVTWYWMVYLARNESH